MLCRPSSVLLNKNAEAIRAAVKFLASWALYYFLNVYISKNHLYSDYSQ